MIEDNKTFGESIINSVVLKLQAENKSLLEHNKALVETLVAIRDFAEERAQINMYLETVYEACNQALTTYKGENTHD